MEITIVTSILAVLIGFCAMAVSFLVLGVSIWQGYETRKNYRLSVVPNLGVNFIFSSDIEFCGISLINDGLGPAIIEEIQIKLKDKSFDYFTQPWTFVKLIETGIKLEKKTSIHFIELTLGSYLPARESHPMIYLKDFSREETNAFLKVLLGVSITIRYKSIYGKSFKTNSILKIPK